LYSNICNASDVSLRPSSVSSSSIDTTSDIQSIKENHLAYIRPRSALDSKPCGALDSDC
jgi:hypothetical protein